MRIHCLVEGKILVKALIDTSSKFNTISKSLFDKLEEDYGICDPDENLYGGVIGVPVGNFYRDVIGEIKCLDLQFQYKGKWRSLDSTEVIDFQIRKNPSFDLVLGQDWLKMHEAKISFGFSPKTCSHYTKIVIDGMSIPLIEENSNKASSVKNDPHKSDLSLEELTNMLKNLSLRSKDNKQRKRHKNKQNHFEEWHIFRGWKHRYKVCNKCNHHSYLYCKTCKKVADGIYRQCECNK